MGKGENGEMRWFDGEGEMGGGRFDGEEMVVLPRGLIDSLVVGGLFFSRLSSQGSSNSSVIIVDLYSCFLKCRCAM